jgi:hypothetical protein
MDLTNAVASKERLTVGISPRPMMDWKAIAPSAHRACPLGPARRLWDGSNRVMQKPSAERQGKLCRRGRLSALHGRHDTPDPAGVRRSATSGGPNKERSISSQPSRQACWQEIVAGIRTSVACVATATGPGYGCWGVSPDAQPRSRLPYLLSSKPRVNRTWEWNTTVGTNLHLRSQERNQGPCRRNKAADRCEAAKETRVRWEGRRGQIR